MKTKYFWKIRAKKYDNLNWVNNDELMHKTVAECFPDDHNLKSLSILDVGTGTAKVLKGIKDFYNQVYEKDSFKLQLCGIDISPDMISFARKDGFNLKLCDVYDLSDETFNMEFDTVVARMMFHHLYHHKKAIENCYKVLKPGGKIVICEGVPPNPSADTFYRIMFALKEERVVIDERQLMNDLYYSGFRNVAAQMIVLEKCSMNNWLDNSGLPQKNIDAIKLMHYEAPKEVKEAYNMIISDDDILMDWKFIIFSGVKL